MRKHPARAMYDQLDDTLTSMTRQLRSAIAADAQPPQASGRARGWARQVSAELASVLLDTVGLAATIEWHVRQYQKCTGILCELTVRSAAGCDLPEDYAATIFDIYSEACAAAASGIAAMRERSRAHAGVCEFAGVPNAGTTVTVTLPIACEARLAAGRARA